MTPPDLPARDIEAAMLSRCAAVARLGAAVADARDSAAERYFAEHPQDRMEPAEVVRCGWVASLPRLRDMLGRKLAGG